MPVDYPAPTPAPTRHWQLRLLNLALGFLVTLGLAMALTPVFDIGGRLS
jgi:hypothetical protein